MFCIDATRRQYKAYVQPVFQNFEIRLKFRDFETLKFARLSGTQYPEISQVIVDDEAAHPADRAYAAVLPGLGNHRRPNRTALPTKSISWTVPAARLAAICSPSPSSSSSSAYSDSYSNYYYCCCSYTSKYSLIMEKEPTLKSTIMLEN